MYAIIACRYWLCWQWECRQTKLLAKYCRQTKLLVIEIG